MKGYENISRFSLIKRMPVIIRVDGKAFHTFSKGFKKPFDSILTETMWETTKFLCENIQGCEIAYTQSDEISLLLTDYEKLNTSSWFEKNIQKMVSISASIATLAFNKHYDIIVENKLKSGEIAQIEYDKLYSKRKLKALFDSRVFAIPKEEVCNCFIWRQMDATRNSIESVGRIYFSHKELYKVNCNQIQDKLFLEKNVNWNDLPIYQKRGACVVKENYTLNNGTIRTRWSIDKEIPIFTQDREYIEKYL